MKGFYFFIIGTLLGTVSGMIANELPTWKLILISALFYTFGLFVGLAS